MLVSSSNKCNFTNSQAINFQGVPQIYKQKVMVLTAQDVKKFLGCYPDSHLITGYFPKDILQFMRRSNKTSKTLSQNIRVFNKAFSEQAKGIRSFENNVINQALTADLNDAVATALLQKAKTNSPRIGFVNCSVKYSLTPDEMNLKLNNTNFSDIMKQTGAIPADGKVSFEFVGKGTYKDCFKVRFLDKDGNDIVHPKAFVIGHDPHLGEFCNNILKKRMQEQITNTDYKQFEKEIQKRILANVNETTENKQKAIDSIKSFYEQDYKSAYYFNGASAFREFDDINGIFAEANAALKIRTDLGKDIDKSNMITPYIFDIKNQCGLLEFADNKLPPVKVVYNFEQHGLKKIDNSDVNETSGRCIDYGCIFPNREKYIDKYFD